MITYSGWGLAVCPSNFALAACSPPRGRLHLGRSWVDQKAHDFSRTLCIYIYIYIY